MADKLLEGYFQILTEVVRKGEKLPFTCFICLSKNNKVFQFLIKNEIIEEERLNKLNTRGFAHIYIRDQEKGEYQKYLEEIVNNSGNTELKSLITKKIAQGDFTGLPKDETGQIIKLIKEQNQDSKIIVKQSQSQLNGLHGNVINRMKDQIEDLEQKLKLSSTDDSELKEWVHGAISKVDQNIHVLGTVIDPESDKILKLSQEIHKQFEIETIKIYSKYNNDSDEHRTIAKCIQPFNEIYNKYVQNNWPKDNEQQKEALEKLKETSAQALSSLRIISGNSDKITFEESLEQIFNSVETGLNLPLNLNPSRIQRANHKFFMKIWMVLMDLKELLSQSDIDITKAQNKLCLVIAEIKKMTEGHELEYPKDETQALSIDSPLKFEKSSNDVLVDGLRIIANKQKEVIDILTNGLKNFRSESQSIIEARLSFQALTKRKLDPNDVIKSSQISKRFQEYDFRFFTEINKQRKQLKSITADFYKQLGDENQISQDDLEFEPSQIIETDLNSATETIESSSAEIDRLRSENNILTTQIENAQLLAETTVKKNSDLEELLRQSGSYANSLEQEVDEIKKRLNKALDESLDTESDRRRLTEGIEETNNRNYQAHLDIQSLTDTIKDKDDRMMALTQERNIFLEAKNNTNSVIQDEKLQKLLIQKENLYKELEKKYEKMKSANDNLKKESQSFNSKLAALEVERKDLVKRVEKANIEKEISRRSEKSLDIKINITNNLLAQNRKTIEKLTFEGEELRQDRLKYIGKTKEIIAEQKTLSSQSATLAAQVQVETQKNRHLMEQIESLKNREAEEQKNMQKIKLGMANILSENKNLKTMLQSKSDEATQSNLDMLNEKIVDLEKKMESLKQENKETNQRYVQEQRKALALEQELRGLKIKSQKAS